jgi:DNA-binding NarL/FixJ family response regulator
MAENGFNYIRRSLKRKMQRFLRSLLVSDDEDEPSGGSHAKEFVMRFDPEMTKILSEMAHQEDMDTGPFVLELVNNALHGQDTLQMIELWQKLTKREQEVAALACQGLTNPQIADALYITEETVKKHISSVLRKYKIRGRGILRWMLEGWNFEHPQDPWKK